MPMTEGVEEEATRSLQNILYPNNTAGKIPTQLTPAKIR